MPTSLLNAVQFERGHPLSIETVLIADPRLGEVLLKIAATGLYHLGLHRMEEGVRPTLPYCLSAIHGHEAIVATGRVLPQSS